MDPVTREFFVYNPSDISHYSPLVRASGRRLPIVPLIIALYFDSMFRAGRSHVDTSDFLIDFGFSPLEAQAYFDDALTLPDHVSLVSMVTGGFTWAPLPAVTSTTPPLPPVPPLGTNGGRRSRRNPLTPPPSTTTSPPNGSHWWHAEQAVRQALEGDGWSVTDTSRLGIGYDMVAAKAGKTIQVEVKSSIGRCSPQLTQTEYDAARQLRRTYYLAIIDNFAPSAAATIVWVQDPARLSMTQRQAIQYALPRSQWWPNAAAAP